MRPASCTSSKPITRTSDPDFEAELGHCVEDAEGDDVAEADDAVDCLVAQQVRAASRGTRAAAGALRRHRRGQRQITLGQELLDSPARSSPGRGVGEATDERDPPTAVAVQMVGGRVTALDIQRADVVRLDAGEAPGQQHQRRTDRSGRSAGVVPCAGISTIPSTLRSTRD